MADLMTNDLEEIKKRDTYPLFLVLTCPECSYPLPYEAEEIKRAQAR